MDSSKLFQDVKNTCFYFKASPYNDNELQVCFQFNLDIIAIIKSIEGYRYNDKKWFIPETKKYKLTEKLSHYNTMACNGDLKENPTPAEASASALKHYNQFNSCNQKRLKMEDDDLDPDYLRYILIDGKTIEIKLPINLDMWKHFTNYRDFQMYCFNHSWYIHGEDNIKNFLSHCKENNYKTVCDLVINKKTFKPIKETQSAEVVEQNDQE